MITTPEVLVENLNRRYAAKKFDPARTIPPDKWSALEQSLILAPSSFGLQPWKFIVITDAATKARLPAISWGQTQPRDCSHFVVIAARKTLASGDVEKYVDSIAQVRDVPRATIDDYRKMMLGTVASMSPEALDAWCARQCYLALGFFLSAAANLGIDTCPMEGIVGAEYDKLLDLPSQGYTALVAAAAGYRAADDGHAALPKVRYPAAEIVTHI